MRPLDLGGGTFDVTVVNLLRTTIEVLASDGDQSRRKDSMMPSCRWCSQK